jgi:hypothetical protein
MDEFKLIQVKNFRAHVAFYSGSTTPITSTNIPAWMYVHAAFPVNNVQ